MFLYILVFQHATTGHIWLVVLRWWGGLYGIVQYWKWGQFSIPKSAIPTHCYSYWLPFLLPSLTLTLTLTQTQTLTLTLTVGRFSDPVGRFSNPVGDLATQSVDLATQSVDLATQSVDLATQSVI